MPDTHPTTAYYQARVERNEMIEPKFPSGPWVTYESRGFQQRPVWVIAQAVKDAPSLAEVNASMTSPLSEEEIEGMAHLIAAAPDLYAALASLLEHTRQGGDAAAFLRYAKAKAALAKAVAQ